MTVALAELPADHQIGANNPPRDPYDAHAAHIDDLYTEASNWCDGADIENEAQAAEVDRLIADFKDAITAAEDSRDAAKKPHADRVKAIQEQYYPLLADTKGQTGKAIRAKAALLAVKTKWANKLVKEQREKADALRKEAEAKAEAAAQAAREAVGNIEASEDAEALIQAARQSASAASAAEAVKVRGMRDNWVIAGFAAGIEIDGAVVSGRSALIRHYMRTRPGDVLDACLEIARTEVRDGKRSIPGLVIENQRRAV